MDSGATYCAGTIGADDEGHRNRRGKDAHRVTKRARDHERDRRESPRREPEALLEHRVRGDELPVHVARQQHGGDDDATEQVADRDLQEGEIAQVREAGDTDEGERARFGGDDRKQHRPPRDLLAGDEVVPGALLAAPEPDT